MKRTEKTLKAIKDPDISLFLKTACAAALKAGSTLGDMYEKPLQVSNKGVTDLVTEADIAAEKVIIQILQENTPGIAILAEESGSSATLEQNNYIWVVDPLDGTTNFAHGFPLFCTSIALLKNSQPVVSAIYAPLLDELFYGCRGYGTYLNQRTLQVTGKQRLIESLIGTGFPYDTDLFLDDILNRISAVLPKVRDIRRAGSAALDLAYVACGRLDGFYEADLKPWDTAAGWLLVEEAGGRVSDFSNGQFSPFVPEIVASNGKIHSHLVNLVA